MDHSIFTQLCQKCKVAKLLKFVYQIMTSLDVLTCPKLKLPSSFPLCFLRDGEYCWLWTSLQSKHGLLFKKAKWNKRIKQVIDELLRIKIEKLKIQTNSL